MPLLPITQVVDLWGPPSSVPSGSDAIALLPDRYRNGDHPALDAVAGGLSAHTMAHEEATGYAAAQSDLLRATDRYLDGLADDRGQVRAAGEDDESFRERIISWKNVSTREAVADAVDTVLSFVDDGKAVLIDPILDGWYVDDGSSAWSSHVWTQAGGGVQNYPDQIYPLRSNANLLDAIPLSDSFDVGRCFGVLVPTIAKTAGELMWVDDGTGALTGCYVDDGSSSVEMAFTSSYSTTQDEAYSAIQNAIEATRTHGVRWFLLDDSRI